MRLHASWGRVEFRGFGSPEALHPHAQNELVPFPRRLHVECTMTNAFFRSPKTLNLKRFRVEDLGSASCAGQVGNGGMDPCSIPFVSLRSYHSVVSIFFSGP